ncbi:DUF6115 domain-containing protein [Halalkalibacter urbisdiaboli]|uniref:DUF6115 domain-containing protein n=1 Tax=Halalkalibacter urbisdiaboli TaxID=1960589 RepID=UPI0010551510|nr:hypothetical protein [Halalkalibacter urbisdiaboli]
MTMTTYLVVISLMLHGVTFLWILTLMQRNAKVEDERRHVLRLKDEIEDMLFSYTNEIKEENKELLKELKLSTKESQARIRQQKDVPSSKNNTSEGNVQPLLKQTPKNNEVIDEDYLPPILDEADNQESVVYEQSDTAKVLALAKQGMSAEAIAKKLSLGKGEVELMLKFYR